MKADDYVRYKCAWCPIDKREHYYSLIDQNSAGHAICWLRQAQKDMTNYRNVIHKIAWMYSHVIPILMEHHGIGSIGTSLIILEVMGKHIHKVWAEVLETFGHPRRYLRFEARSDPLKHEIIQYIEWRLAHYKYSKNDNKGTIILSPSWWNWKDHEWIKRNGG